MIDLRASARIEMDKTSEAVRVFPWEDARAYGLWLAQTYQMVNHSTRLVALAGAYTPIDKNELHARFVDHAKEERGHQLICIADLKALGKTLADFPCLFQSAAMYQIQYYWVQHRGAVSFFGYTLALECLAAAFGARVHDRVVRAHGESAARFLKVHSEADLEHTEMAFRALEKLSASERELVQENLELSANLYRSMLDEVRSRTEARGPQVLEQGKKAA